MRSSYYAAPAPEIMHCNEYKKMEIALIRNGSFVNKIKNTKYNNESFVLFNTCPFDPIIQALSCAFCYSKKYSIHIESNYKFIGVYDIIKTLVTKGPISKTLQLITNHHKQCRGDLDNNLFYKLSRTNKMNFLLLRFSTSA